MRISIMCVAEKVFKVDAESKCHFAANKFRSRLLLLTFQESDIFVRATGVNRDAGKLPTLHSLGICLIE